MSNETPYLAAYEQALDALTSDHSLDPYDQEDMDRAAAALMRVIKRRRQSSGTASTAQAIMPNRMPPQSPKSRPYDGLSVAEATVAYLSTLPERETKSPAEIIAHLIEHGYGFEADKPEIALTTALRRRTGNFGDVIKVGRGQWGLRDWYSQRDLTALRHKERTRAGMDAARARGVTFGKAWKLNAEQAAEFKRLAARGAKNAELCEAFSLSGMAVTRYRKRLKNWNPGDPYPPPEEPETPSGNTEATGEGSQKPFRVIK